MIEERKWADIAHDIAMLTVPAEGGTSYTAQDIVRAHGITDVEFKSLLALEAFQNLVKAEVKCIKDMGPHAGARIRAEAMAIKLQETLFQRATCGDLDDKLAVQLLGMLLKSAGLEQPPEVVKAQAQAAVVNNIAFNIPRLPKNNKLSHLMKQPQTNVIDIEG